MITAFPLLSTFPLVLMTALLMIYSPAVKCIAFHGCMSLIPSRSPVGSSRTNVGMHTLLNPRSACCNGQQLSRDSQHAAKSDKVTYWLPYCGYLCHCFWGLQPFTAHQCTACLLVLLGNQDANALLTSFVPALLILHQLFRRFKGFGLGVC